jgi:hypothetical protein
MQKLRTLPILMLPLIQLLLAAALLRYGRTVPDPMQLDTMYVPTVTLVCYGINAPVLLIRPVIGVLAGAGAARRTAFGFGLDEILFLIGVALLWYIVARRLATYLSPEAIDRARGPLVNRSLWVVLDLFAGILLLFFGIELMRSLGKWNNPTGNLAESLLFILWGAALLSLALAGMISARRAAGAKMRDGRRAAKP